MVVLRVAGPEERGGDIGTGTPIGGDGNIDLAAVSPDRRVLYGNQVFGAGGDHQLAAHNATVTFSLAVSPTL